MTRHLIAVPLVLLATACILEPSAPPAVSRLMPLAVGTEWHYRKTDSTEIGEPLGLPEERFTVRVRRDTTVAGRQWAVLENGDLLLADRSGGPLLMQNRADGLYERSNLPPGFPEGPFELAFRVFKYPVQRGELSTPIPPVMVTATDTVIRVPAGEFRTVRYDMPGYLTYFVSPGVGIVKEVRAFGEELDRSGQVIARWYLVYELESFTTPS